MSEQDSDNSTWYWLVSRALHHYLIDSIIKNRTTLTHKDFGYLYKKVHFDNFKGDFKEPYKAVYSGLWIEDEFERRWEEARQYASSVIERLMYYKEMQYHTEGTPEYAHYKNKVRKLLNAISDPNRKNIVWEIPVCSKPEKKFVV